MVFSATIRRGIVVNHLEARFADLSRACAIAAIASWCPPFRAPLGKLTVRCCSLFDLGLSLKILFAITRPTKAETANPSWNFSQQAEFLVVRKTSEATMNGLIYLIGLIVVIMFILSFLGLH